jgi:1-deoxy-D-xylulose 5-phosphate reductoisomerase
VRLFLDRKIRFGDIARLVGEVLDAHTPLPALTLEAVERADRWARVKLQGAAASRLRS